MIDLGSTEFFLAVPSVPRSELELRSTSLFDSWESFVEASLALPDYSLFLQVEEGSIRGKAKIGALLGAVYLGVGHYGDFVSGVRTITEQLSATGDYVAERAGRAFSCPDSRSTIKKRGGSLAALQRLFVKVQKGRLTPDEAMERATSLLGTESTAEPGFMQQLADALNNCPRYPEQRLFPFGDSYEEENQLIDKMPPPPRQPRARPDVGPPLQFRVEVWRESKKKRKQTRVVQL
jgi:hypothetical protein